MVDTTVKDLSERTPLELIIKKWVMFKAEVMVEETIPSIALMGMETQIMGGKGHMDVTQHE